MVSEQDLSVDLQGKLKSLKEGKQVLGDHDDVQRALFDALPSVIAERVKAITPRDFVVAELELKLSLGGTIFGVGLSGDVTVKLAPRGDH
jgi:hypothetical protein